MIPGEREALRIHSRCKSGERLIQHCRAVASVSRILADEMARKGIHVNERAVMAGALLHDIGRTRIQTVQHGLEGSRILEDFDVDGSVREIVKKHVGAGILPDEARSLGFPSGDYVPRTVEEKIVCFADKMVGVDDVQPFSDEVRKFVRKGLDVDRLQGLRFDLTQLLGEDPEVLVLQKTKEESVSAGS